MKYPLMLCAALVLAMPAVQAQTAPTPAQPAAQSAAKSADAPPASGCERMKANMQEMGDHMKRMGGTGMGCGHHGMRGMHGMQGDKTGKTAQDAQAKGGNREMGDCMGRMSEMMKEMVPIAKECDRMTPEMNRRLERHEKEMKEWRKAPAN